MRVGTKSVLFGVHQFALHPLFVAIGWWRLYGFPTSPWLWIAFFVHDLGYIGKANMDGAEGEEHPWLGARIMYWLQGAWIFLRQPVFYERELSFSPLRWWQLSRRWGDARLSVSQQEIIWGNEALYHSRYMAKQYGTRPSRLCFADKLAITVYPRWLYLSLARATGEIAEYMAKTGPKYAAEGRYAGDDLHEFHRDMCEHVIRYVNAHKDGRDDTWTGRRFPEVTA